jgi:hypothetical protein
MVLSFDIKGTPLSRISKSDRAFLRLTDDDVFKLGVELMSFKGQKPNGPDDTFVLTEDDQLAFAIYLENKGYEWARIIPVVLLGASWSRKVD